MLLAPSFASAADFPVTTTADGNDGACNSHCTLREAVAAASAATTTDSITVPAGTYVLSQGGELSLSGDALNGAGARTTIIDGGGSSRVIAASNPGQVTPSISRITVRGGNGSGQAAPTGNGGGIFVSGALAIADSHIYANSGTDGGGIHLASGADLTMVGSTVAGNTASTSTGSDGGGIYSANEGIIAIANSTISGNIARDTGPNAARGGGIYSGAGTAVILSNVTLAANEAAAGNGGGLFISGGPTSQFANAMIAENTGGACGGTGVPDIAPASHHNLVTDGTCTLTGPGNLQGVGAAIAGLADNGGPTDTRALASTSPAVNAGSDCATTDQRGVTRAAACDIGAFEYVAPTLTVTTTVTNNDGGEDGPADFSVRVRDAGGADVGGSPQAGSATGTIYTLAPGSFTVSADGPNLYTLAVGGACSAAGAVTLGENQTATCTVTADDRAPVAGRSVGAIPVSGTVRVKRPGGRFRVLREGDLLPNGTTIDTLKGRVTLIAAANKRGKESKADFYDGVFKLRQSKGSRPTTTLTLVEKLSCAKAGSASTAAKRKKKRRLWGDGSGKFRTKGKHSAATVVGTKWLVEDRCASTLTRVVRGRVKVRDFVKKKTVTVRKGKRYIARARD